tara:strand:+ start:31819 stop:32058 length:240 start_codon:yes stop_codon:yes gene_type:complete
MVYTFELDKTDNIGQPTYIKAVVHYKSQDKWDQLDIGANYKTTHFTLDFGKGAFRLEDTKKNSPITNPLYSFLGFKQTT